MKLQSSVGLFLVLSIVVAAAAELKYIAEKPPYLTRCKLADPAIEQCLAKNFQVIFTEWKDGLPGFKGIGPIDPLIVKRISVAQNNDNPVAQVSFDLRDVKTVGLSTIQVKDVRYDRLKRTVKFKMAARKISFFFNYSTQGHILRLELNGSGNGTAAIDDMEMSVGYRFKRRYEDGFLFHTLEKVRLEISNIGKFNLHLDNLFNGQRDLEETANTLINNNWRTFYDVLGPAITEATETIMADRLKKILLHVPMNYFIDDDPEATK